MEKMQDCEIFGCVILDCGQVKIGNQVLIGPNVGIILGLHYL